MDSDNKHATSSTSSQCPYCPGPSVGWGMGPDGWAYMKEIHDKEHVKCLPEVGKPNISCKYRKKPVEIEAVQIPTDANDALGHGRIAGWLFVHDFYGWHVENYGPNGEFIGLMIETLEGVMFGAAGDWIIRGVKGEFYPCKPDIFEVTYEPA